VEPSVWKCEKLAPVMGGIKVRLGQVSLIYFLSCFQTHTQTHTLTALRHLNYRDYNEQNRV